MSGADRDGSMVRKPLIAFAVVLLLASTVLALSFHFRDQREQRRQLQLAELQALQSGRREAVAAAHAVHRYRHRYQRLDQRGFIGAEPRLRWIESVRAAGRAQHIDHILYRVHEQHPYQGNLGIEHSGYGLYASAMVLQLNLSHEGELLRFLDALEAQQNGLFDLTGCSMTPGFVGATPTTDRPNLVARCELLWYTVRPAGEAAAW